MAFCIAGFLVYLLYFTWEPASGRLQDFQVYYTAGQKAAQGKTVYDVQGHWQFKYSPAIAQGFAATFSQLDLYTAKLFYFTFNALLWLIWIALVTDRLSADWKKHLTLAFLSILFFGKAILRDCELGQANSITLILSLLAFYFFSKRKSMNTLAGAFLLACAIQFKLYWFLAFPILVFKRHWNAMILTSVLLPLVSLGTVAMIHGWEFSWSEHLAWINTLFHSSHHLLPSYYNISVIGIFSKWIDHPKLNLVLWAGCVVGFLLASFQRRHLSWRRQYAWVCLGIVLLNPLSWMYWIAFLIPLVCEVALLYQERSIQQKTMIGVPAWLIWFGLDLNLILSGTVTALNAFFAFLFLKRTRE